MKVLALFLPIFILVPSISAFGFNTKEKWRSRYFDFAEGKSGFRAGFSDLPVGQESNFRLHFIYKDRPLSSGQGKSFFLSGMNHSDDLFMFLWKELSGFSPNQDYQAYMQITFASREPNDAVGTGGSPTHSVYVKAGLISYRPEVYAMPRQNRGPYWQINLDKGNQSQSGEDMIVLGDLSKPPQDAFNTQFTIIHRSTQVPIQFKSNHLGKAYLIVGTDSGFEGQTSLFYTQIAVHYQKTTF